MAKLLIKWFQMVVLAAGLGLAMTGWAKDADSTTQVETERPGYHVVLFDAILVRPLTLAATVVGSVLFVATLPITIPTGTIGEAGMTLVGDPALNTFARCLGCTEVGWRKLPPKDLNVRSE